MSKSNNFQRDCTDYCKSVVHGDLITTAFTVLDVSALQLCSYLNFICTNCDLVKDSVGRTALHTAASYGSLEVVRWLLNIKNANINAKDDESGYTPLHRALYFGRIHVAVELMKLGANSTLRDMNGLTAIEHVIEDGPKPDANFGTLYTWGLNKNNSLGSFSSRTAPECLDIFHKKHPKEAVQQICIDKFHSVILTTTGDSFSCGHGLGGRLGLGTEHTVVNPTKIDFQSSEKVLIIEVSIARDHCLFLTSDNLVYSCGLNKYKVLGVTPPPEKGLFPQKIKHLQSKKIIGISSSRYHSAAWTSTTLYTWGLNGGQLGHEPSNGNYQVIIPKSAQVINVGDSTIQKVVSSDGAIAVLTARGDVYVLHEYQCRKIASRILNIKDLAIIGGKLNTASDKDLKRESLKELKIVVLTTTGNLLLWQESDPQLCRCIYSIPRVLIVKQVSININGILFVTNYGEAYTAVIKSRKRKTVVDRKNNLNVSSSKDECIILKLSKIPRIYRAISIVSDPRGEDLCVIQQNPHGSELCEENDLENEMEYHLTRLLEEAIEEDNIHDVLIKINNQTFPAHKYILAEKSNLLNELRDDTNEIILKDVNTDFFHQILYYIYTGTCTLLEVGECPTQFIEYCIDPSGKEESSNKIPKKKNPIRLLQELSKRFGCKELYQVLNNYDMQSIYIFRRNEINSITKNYVRNDFPEYQDIILKCSDDIEIKAHKCILVARLEYFSNLFASRWNNDSKNSIVIPYPSNLVEALIEFLYTDSKDFLLGKDGDFLLKLLVLADEYLVDQLKNCCANIILSLNYLNLKNAVEILQLAHYVKSSLLKRGVMKYIVNNMPYFLETGVLDDISDEILTDISVHYITYRQVDRRYLSYNSASAISEEIVDVHCNYPVSLEIPEKKKLEKISSKISKRKSKSLRIGINDKTIKKISGDENNPDTVIQFPDTIDNDQAASVDDNGNKSTRKRLSAISAAIDILKTENYEPEYTSLNSYSSSTSFNDFPVLNSPPEGNYHKLSSPPNHGKLVKKHRMVRLSQKERMRLSSESKETTQVIPESPKNPWKMILPDTTNPIAYSSTDSAFSNILSDERKLKENFVKFTNKLLVHTQLEDRAIMDLERFYNIDSIEDEVITVQRVNIGNIASPIWVPSNRAHSSHS